MYFHVNRKDNVLSDAWSMFHNLKNLISRENEKNVCTIY